jgi:hypothetical protein
MSEREIFSGFHCLHLDVKHAQPSQEIDVSFPSNIKLDEIDVGIQGICETGERGNCPVLHKCRIVTVIKAKPSILATIDPQSVDNKLSDEETQAHCVRPDRWFNSTRAFAERMGMKTYGGVNVADMTYEPDIEAK